MLGGFAVGRRLVDVLPAVHLSGWCEGTYRKGWKSIIVGGIGINVLDFISLEFQSEVDPLFLGLLRCYRRAFAFAP
jgi:hypothetical protein